MDERFEKLAEILQKVLKVPIETIRPESRLLEDLQATSLDAGMVLMEIEECFDVLVPERGREYRTVADLRAHLEELLLERELAAAQTPVIPER